MNHEYVADTFEHKGLTIKLIQDQDASSPREDDNAGTMVCWHRRYKLGDEQRTDNPSDWEDSLAEDIEPGIVERLDNALYTSIVTTSYHEEAKHKAQVAQFRAARAERINKILDANYIILPLGLLDHSGITMYVGSGAHSCDYGGWDSGQVGFIYMTKAKAIEEWGKKRLTKHVRAMAEKCLRCEVQTYDQFLTGDVYGFVISDSEGNDVDSCWGHFGIDYAKEAAVEAAEDHLRYIARELAESAGDVPMSRKEATS